MSIERYKKKDPSGSLRKGENSTHNTIQSKTNKHKKTQTHKYVKNTKALLILYRT